MASAKPWPKAAGEAAPDSNRAAIYRERAAHLRAIAEAEPDPQLRVQLLDLARQYEEMADSAGPRRHMIGFLPTTLLRRRARRIPRLPSATRVRPELTWARPRFMSDKAYAVHPLTVEGWPSG
jgi:hypothetical protein